MSGVRAEDAGVRFGKLWAPRGVVIAVLALGAMGCGRGVGGPETVALEADAPVLSDLELATAERVLYERRDPSGVAYQTPSVHEQRFQPRAGVSLGDVMRDIQQRSQAAGWDLAPNGALELCGARPRPSEGIMSVKVGQALDGSETPKLGPYVYVILEPFDQCQ